MAIPSSTYRIQFHKDFTFQQLKAILSYLQELGVSAVYASPVMKAVPGSMHGYDVTDPHRINPEVGTIEELRDISGMLQRNKMMWIQDIVPNHMAFSMHNTRLKDVIERGSDSPYYTYFDINWNHHQPHLKNKLMVPVLGKEASECINAKEINVSFSADGLSINYYEEHFPVSIHTYELIREFLIRNNYPEEISVLLNSYQSRAREVNSLDNWLKFRQAWMKDCMNNESCKKALEEWTAEVNANGNQLTQLLDMQNIVLTYWKHTEKEINYRRFFTVNSLLCLRMESSDVFKEYHEYLYALYLGNVIHGLRIDHIDGLNDPALYIKNLRRLFGNDCYIIAEKILEGKEVMPEQWSIEGTSGYEFLSFLNQLFTNRKGAQQLVKSYKQLLPDMPPYDTLVQNNKKLILDKHMAGELDNITHYFFELNLQLNFSFEQIKNAMANIMLSLPVYRIYPDALPLKETNLKLLDETFEKARALNNGTDEALEYLYTLFAGSARNRMQTEDIISFLKRLMQFTGPLTAKGVEDTTFYIYNPLISHDEVGDTPSLLGISIPSFHKRMIQRQQTTPLSLNATATHDTKRGEDARIRLNCLSEMPDAWTSNIQRWYTINAPFRKTIHGEQAPSVNDEYFIYQSIVGGFPEDFKVTEQWIDRLQQYIVKVVREAKVISSWESPNEEYEKACMDFIHSILNTKTNFLADFLPFIKTVCDNAWVYSLSQAMIKITTPGIPDIYQGCELYDLSYVDPDNRRPVDYQKRIHLLQEIKSKESEGNDVLFSWLEQHANSGVAKMYTTYKVLQFRRKHPDLFNAGEYIPLDVAETVLVFARQLNREWIIVIVPLGDARKNIKKGADLPDIFIPLPDDFPIQWNNIFTGENIISKNGLYLRTLVDLFPVALLHHPG